MGLAIDNFRLRFSCLKAVYLSVLCGILLGLTFLNGKLWLLAWFGFLPLFSAIQNKSPGKAFALAYLSGVVFWSLTIYWLIHVTLLGEVLLILYLALYFGLFGLLCLSCKLLTLNLNFLALPSLWVVLEYLRSYLFTGFGWALVGYSQYLNVPIIQIADLTGVYGVSFLVVMANACLWKIMLAGGRLGLDFIYGKPVASEKLLNLIGRRVLFTTVLFILCLDYGFHRLNQKTEGCSLRVSLIQGNIPQELKWTRSSQNFILKRYTQLTQQAASLSPDLIVWPEASIPGFLGTDENIFAKIFTLVRLTRAKLLAGSVVVEKMQYFNSALLIDKDGRLTGRYDKLHLVPFGEYIPLKNIFSFLETVVPIGDFSPGREYTLFSLPTLNCAWPSLKYPRENISWLDRLSIPGLDRQGSSDGEMSTKFAVLICFEDTLPQLARNFTRRGASFLVNITNDAWYKKTVAAYQHLSASVFRAVENRVNLLRSANTGVSCFIDSKGNITKRLLINRKDIFVTGVVTQDINLGKGESLYQKIGDLFVLGCFMQIIFLGINDEHLVLYIRGRKTAC